MLSGTLLSYIPVGKSCSGQMASHELLSSKHTVIEFRIWFYIFFVLRNYVSDGNMYLLSKVCIFNSLCDALSWNYGARTVI